MQTLANLIVYLCCFCFFFDQVFAKKKQTFTIAAFFDVDVDRIDEERMFKYAIENINSDANFEFSLEYDISNIVDDNSFDASKKLCRALRSHNGISAVLGPSSSQSSMHLRSICNAMDIPYIETVWNSLEENADAFSNNFFPNIKLLGKAYGDFIKGTNWENVVILYQNTNNLFKLEAVLNSTDSNRQVLLRKLDSKQFNFKKLLKSIRNLKLYKNFILDCDIETAQRILENAMSLGMITVSYQYFLTSFDIELLDVSGYEANITGFSLVRQNSHFQSFIKNYRKTTAASLINNNQNQNRNHHHHQPIGQIETESILIYDAVKFFALALEKALKANKFSGMPLDCSKNEYWANGLTLINFIQSTRMSGLSGDIQFVNGNRRNFTLNLIEISLGTGPQTVGVWKSLKSVLSVKRNETLLEEEVKIIMEKTVYNVTTIKEEPYVFVKNTTDGTTYMEGFIIDLLAAIQRKFLILYNARFNYTVKLVSDGKYGGLGSDNLTWNGMIGELLNGTAQLAVAPLTITYLRESVVDFTKPFMNLGISILFKKPEKKNPSLFSFLSPLSIDIWVYMLVAYLGVSFCLFLVARFTPYEWHNPHPCDQDSDILENDFTIQNSLWFTIGSLMQQGSEVAPRAMSTRIVAGFWWFFTLIIISSYTANLAAFLTVERMTSPIESADDLAKQTAIKYGTVIDGSTESFFRSSTIDTYKRMWNFMSQTSPSVFVKNNDEGIYRVKKGDYAFLMESAANEYKRERDCDLMQVGGLLDTKGYGIGLPQGMTTLKEMISNAILKLQEEQEVQILYNKWWKEKGGGGQCEADDNKQKDANALSIANVGGIFVVLVSGLVLSLLVAVLEFVWKVNKNTEIQRKSVCTEIVEELRFAVSCTGSSKKSISNPAHKKRGGSGGSRNKNNNGLVNVPLNSSFARETKGGRLAAEGSLPRIKYEM